MQATALRDRVVIVTGAGTGIGRGFVLGLAREGAKVVGIGRTEADLAETRRLLGGGSFEYLSGDVAQRDDVERLFTLAESKFGPVEMLVNNAAVYPKLDFLSQDIEDFERGLLINVMGVARPCHRALPVMLQRGFGRIVNIGSFSHLNPPAQTALYSASKGAVSVFTKTLAKEVDHGRYPNVLINELVPGVFRTRMTPDRGEDPSESFQVLRPLLTLGPGGHHGQVFERLRHVVPGGDGGLRGRVKRLVKSTLRL